MNIWLFGVGISIVSFSIVIHVITLVDIVGDDAVTLIDIVGDDVVTLVYIVGDDAVTLAGI